MDINFAFLVLTPVMDLSFLVVGKCIKIYSIVNKIQLKAPLFVFQMAVLNIEVHWSYGSGSG